MTDFQSQISLSLLSSSSLTSIFFSHSLIEGKRFLWSGPTISCKWLSRSNCPKSTMNLGKGLLKLVIGLWCSCDGLFSCDCFSCLKTFMTYSLILSLPMLLAVDSQNPLNVWSKDSDARRTGDVIITDNWSLHQQWGKLKMKYWTSLHLFSIEDLKYLLTCVFDCYRKSLSLSILDQHFIFGYQKLLMHIMWSPFFSSIISFQSIKSYLLRTNSSSLASLNLGARFLLRGIVCHILKFQFCNVNHFP
jgi:hypothetical protein